MQAAVQPSPRFRRGWRSSLPATAAVVVIRRRGRIVWHHIAFLNHHRRRLHQHLTGSRRPSTDAAMLHRRDHRFADALLMQQDDVVDLQLLLNAARLNLVDDHRVAQPALRHVDDVADRDGGLPMDLLLLLMGISPLLLGVVLSLTLLSDFLVASVADHGPADRADRAADSGPSSRFAIIFADDPADNSATESAQNRSPLRVLSICLLRPDCQGTGHSGGQRETDPSGESNPRNRGG